MSKTPKPEEEPQIIESEDEPTELEYIQQLLDDFDLKRTDTIGNLLEALEDEDENCEDEDDENS